jgi:hypothetical protein
MIQATVVAAWTEYIHQLEKRNARLAKERDANPIRIAVSERYIWNESSSFHRPTVAYIYIPNLPDINPTAGRCGARSRIYQHNDTDLPHTNTHMAEVRGDIDGITVLESTIGGGVANGQLEEIVVIVWLRIWSIFMQMKVKNYLDYNECRSVYPFLLTEGTSVRCKKLLCRFCVPTWQWKMQLCSLIPALFWYRGTMFQQQTYSLSMAMLRRMQ